MSFKNISKNFINKIPFGQKLILPCLIYIHSPYLKYSKKKAEINEARKILRVCNNHNVKYIVIIYDLLPSPLTYGDFFYTLMLARFFLLFKKKIIFWIIDSEFRIDAMKSLSKEERNSFVREIKEMCHLLLSYHGEEIEIKNNTWNNVEMLLNNYNYRDYNTSYILFEEFVKKRKAFYLFSFNVLNILFTNNPGIEINNFLISQEEILPHLDIKLPESNYITWHVRYSEKWGSERNTSPDEFLNIYTSLKNFFSDYKIMIISDIAGCEYFRKISYEKKIDIIFSKDFSKSFIGDVALILNSKYFFALRGGGIASVPVFSKIPYGFIAKPVHERPFSKNKFAVWSTEKQVYINKDKYNPEDVLFCLKTID